MWGESRYQELVDTVRTLLPLLEERLREGVKERPLPFALRLQLEELSALVGTPGMRL
jgi:hypothetical protein